MYQTVCVCVFFFCCANVVDLRISRIAPNVVASLDATHELYVKFLAFRFERIHWTAIGLKADVSETFCIALFRFVFFFKI